MPVGSIRAKTTIKSVIAATFAVLTSSAPAFAETPYCAAKADGENRIPKTGVACSAGYFSTGNRCEALQRRFR